MTWDEVGKAILSTPRAEAIARGHDPAELAALLDKVRRHAYKIVDRDVEGVDVDTLYESVLAAGFGVADEQRRRALEAIG
ncbi:MAG TPA: hypothetical protein VFM96_15820 [Gaiellaceae bacterium]|nr:hypothetical protein [Gaiellaceae bacterium]